MENRQIKLNFQDTNGHCPAGEATGNRMIARGNTPVISCEGSCIRGEIARLAANMLAGQDGYGRGCHGEMLSVPRSAMAKWAGQARKIVVIDGCFLHCHGRMMEGVYGRDKLAVFDALAVYNKYTDIMDIDDVPESERKEAAAQVLEKILETMKTGAVGTDFTESSGACCTGAARSGCCGS